jgi:hypothetical protein
MGDTMETRKLSQFFEEIVESTAKGLAAQSREMGKNLTLLGDIELPEFASVHSYSNNVSINTYNKDTWLECFNAFPVHGMKKVVEPYGVSLKGKINGVNVSISLYISGLCEIQQVKKRKTVVVETKVVNCKPITAA